MEDRLISLCRHSACYKVFDREMTYGGSHAYLLLSEDPALLDRMVTLLCMRVYCPVACGTCAECHKVLSGNKMDVAQPNPLGEKLTADQARSIAEDAVMGAYEGGYKVYVLRAMDQQRDVVQNILLKTLEEPNPKVMFLLTASSTKGVLPTVLSRVKTLPQCKLTVGEVADVLSERSVKDGGFWARCSGGNLALAVNLSQDDKYVETIDRTTAMLLHLKRSQEVVDYVFSPDFDKENIARTLDVLSVVLEDLLMIAGGNPQAVTYLSQTATYRLVLQDLPYRALPALMNLAEVAKQKLQANCNPQSVADSLLLGYLEEKANANHYRN